jgi:hypothetical protein
VRRHPQSALFATTLARVDKARLTIVNNDVLMKPRAKRCAPPKEGREKGNSSSAA